MTKKRLYKGISKRAKVLLEMDENNEIEFKSNANNLKGEDFVSFANSEFGGTILIGIEEYTDSNGRQKGRIIGCSIGDEEKRSLNSKAQQCSPPVDIEIIVENENSIPFYRVEIPSGLNKPYCSSGGTYKIRKDGQKEALHPQDLLRIFMKEESGKFLQKFKESTIELREEILTQNLDLMDQIVESSENTQSNISSTLSDIEGIFDEVSYDIKETEKEISDNLRVINEKNDQANEYFDDAQDRLREEVGLVKNKISHLDAKLNLMLNKFGLEDPEITKTREFIKFNIAMQKSIFEAKNKDITQKIIEEEYEKWTERNFIVRKYFAFEDFEKLFNLSEFPDPWVEGHTPA